MQQFWILAILLFLLPACSDAQPKRSMNDTPNHASVPQPLQVEFNLTQYRWQHRVVLVFAPSERSPAYQQQLQAWQANSAGIQDRDLKLVKVLGTGESQADGQPISPAAAARLRQQFDIALEEFAVILVGKDGTEKQRQQAPIDLTELFSTIDAMPMRQQEMRDRQ